MIGHRLVREDIVGTLLNAIKNLKHIWFTSPLLACAGYTHTSVIYIEHTGVINWWGGLTTDVTFLYSSVF